MTEDTNQLERARALDLTIWAQKVFDELPSYTFNNFDGYGYVTLYTTTTQNPYYIYELNDEHRNFEQVEATVDDLESRDGIRYTIESWNEMDVRQRYVLWVNGRLDFNNGTLEYHLTRAETSDEPDSNTVVVDPDVRYALNLDLSVFSYDVFNGFALESMRRSLNALGQPISLMNRKTQEFSGYVLYRVDDDLREEITGYPDLGEALQYDGNVFSIDTWNGWVKSFQLAMLEHGFLEVNEDGNLVYICANVTHEDSDKQDLVNLDLSVYEYQDRDGELFTIGEMFLDFNHRRRVNDMLAEGTLQLRKFSDKKNTIFEYVHVSRSE